MMSSFKSLWRGVRRALSANEIESQQNHSDGAQRRKILIHAINYAPELIGCAKYTSELAQYLVAQGHLVEVVTAPPHYPGWRVREPYSAFSYSSETIDGVRISRCPMAMKADAGGVWRLLAPMSFGLAAAPMLLWRALRFRPDAIMCVEPTLFSAPIAVIAAKLLGARSLLHVQDLEVDAAFGVGHIKGAALKNLAVAGEAFLLRAFDHIVTISFKMRAALAAKGLDSGAIRVLRNWVDTSAICPTDRRANSFRAELKLPDDAYVVLYAGHIGVKQALDMVVDAARRLKDEKNIYFVIAGAGPVRQSLIAASADLPNVLHLPLQPAEKLNELLGLADLHVLPQHRGAADLVLPSKLSGMLASGRPVVATAEPDTELYDILNHVAVLTPSGDAQSLAAAILLASQSDLSQQAEAGLRLAESMGATRILPQFEALLTAPTARLAEIKSGETAEAG
jgi:colanic acid biosynthesis glycosyl transferase WcaI